MWLIEYLLCLYCFGIGCYYFILVERCMCKIFESYKCLMIYLVLLGVWFDLKCVKLCIVLLFIIRIYFNVIFVGFRLENFFIMFVRDIDENL